MTTKTDRAELRRKAEAATPGPWEIGDGCVQSTLDGHPLVTVGQCDEDEQYIAAANPAAVLALLDQLDAAERERDGLKQIIGVLSMLGDPQHVETIARLRKEAGL